jgi:3-methylfumaryl-CoA hydratase
MTTDYADWIGRTDTSDETICLAPAQEAAATLEEHTLPIATGGPLPPLWHWFYFLPRQPQSMLGHDGHPQRGGFMPPVPYPRRMFAGARLRFHQPLRIGELTRREGVIRDVRQKSGRSGALAFVTVHYQFLQQGELCIEEEQDIVYREPGAPVPPPQPTELPLLPEGAWSRMVVPDTRLLFRFSALTFNAHRIHYDRPYALNEEGYPGLVVHGPLTALLLLALMREQTTQPMIGFRFRLQAPLFDLAPFRLVAQRAGEQVELEAQTPEGQPALTATAELG